MTQDIIKGLKVSLECLLQIKRKTSYRHPVLEQAVHDQIFLTVCPHGQTAAQISGILTYLLQPPQSVRRTSEQKHISCAMHEKGPLYTIAPDKERF